MPLLSHPVHPVERLGLCHWIPVRFHQVDTVPSGKINSGSSGPSATILLGGSVPDQENSPLPSGPKTSQQHSAARIFTKLSEYLGSMPQRALSVDSAE